MIAIRTDSFVMMAADTLGSYGSLSRFHDIQRIIKVGGNTMLGAGGEISDFQQVTEALQELEFSNAYRIIAVQPCILALLIQSGKLLLR